jgi:Uncharacterised nucleotidyltransferase
MAAEHALPSLKTVERVLRETTERLARECSEPTANPPDWSDFQWCVARAAAAIQGVSPLLSQRLRWPGPPAWRAFIDQERQHTCEHHEGIAQLIGRVDAAAREAGISIMGLKGAALHALGIYTAGARPMADLDLLVSETQVAAACALLSSLGYRQSYSTRRERTFVSGLTGAPAGLGESGGSAVKIELHSRISELLPVRAADITELLRPERGSGGLHYYESVAALMTHLLLHAAGNTRTRSLRMLQLNDIAELSARLGSADWEQVLQYEQSVRPGWAFPPLALTARYYPNAIPAEVLARAGALCTGMLRRISSRQRISDVSLSYLWIQFCPGLEWCGSIAEVLRYMRIRALPSVAAKLEASNCEATQTWALNSPWTGSSRARRVARWLVSRPPRVATMWSVRTAWEQAGMPST